MPPSVAYDKVMLPDDSGVAELTAKLVSFSDPTCKI